MFIASEAGVPWVSIGGRKVCFALRVLCNELRHKAWLVITLPPASHYSGWSREKIASLNSEEFQFSTSTSLLLRCLFRKYFFLLLCFSLLVTFLYGSLVSVLYTFKTRSIILILRVTHSSRLSNFLFLFIFPQEFHHWFAVFISELLSSSPPVCALLLGAVCHIIVSCSPDCCSFSVHFISCFAFFH